MKDKYYYKDGSVLDYHHYNRELHRADGPAVEYANGGKEWWVDDKRHKVDGPACEYANGSKSWWVDNKRHRVDGPAVEWAGGDKEWWIDGKWLTEEEFNMHPKVEHHKFQILLEEVLSEG